MPLTRLDNLISSKTGRYLYVSPDDFNASDALDNRGNSPTRPFLTIQRAFLEVARYSYAPKGVENDPDNDRFDQFSILLSPGNHYIDNRPGLVTADSVPVFNYVNGEWSDSSILDLSNPNNILYKFNSAEGGAIIPRGTSLVGTDLRRTQIRPLYVPDPADKDVGRTSIFQVTGGCYFWQFTILDGDTSKNSPLYDAVNKVGKVYSQPDITGTTLPLYSHHKITNFVFARKEDLGLLYQKIAKAFSGYQPEIDDPDEFGPRVQENRIVGPLTDSNQIESIKVDNVTVGTASYTKITVNTKVDHLFFVNQAVAVTNVAIREKLNGVFYVSEISTTNKRQFSYLVDGTAAGLGLTNGQTVTDPSLLNKSGTIATVQAEVDSVESASPYVFNVSIRSTWGICGIWADGSRASGFKSMVIAQYTGVSLQKDDRAFIRYDELTNTWNQANLQDAFSTTPYHIDGTAYWKDDWRNFHVRASDDSFIQCVSIFAVGFADHFLMESGGDMSITNSNSNFGNTSLHTKGYKGFSFNQDKGGYISDIIPPKKIDSTDTKDIFYYPFNLQLTRQIANAYRLYLNPPVANDPDERPASSIDGNKIGGKSGETISVKLDAVGTEAGKQLKSSLITPNGVEKWTATLTALSPTASGINNLDQDAANLIDANKEFIQEEAFGYIFQKYPNLQNIPYVNPNITNETGRYRDASSLIKLNRQEIVDTSYADMMANAAPNPVPPDLQTKCKRDIGYIVDAVANDLYSGGNSNIVDATKAYFGGAGVLLTNGLSGETASSAYAFGKARDYMKQALTNQLTVKDLTIIADTATNSNTNPASCANVQLTVDALISIINTSIEAGNLSSLPSRNIGPWSVVSENSKCKRDIGYIVEAITSDLRRGGNQNVVNAAQAYYTGTQLDYIENEKTESLDAYQYVRDLAVAAMRNWNFIRQNCVTSVTAGNTTIGGVSYPTASIVNVGSTLGIVVGMRVTGTGMPTSGSGAYVKRIISSTQIQLGVQFSRLATGNSVNAISAQSNTTLTFALNQGAWSTTIQPQVDSSIITTNAGYPECASVASAIDTYYQIIYTIINTPNGINSVTINSPSTVNDSVIAQRATLFRLNEINSGTNTNPHKLETGTPVKLVPRAINSTVDKRFVRLPRGFDTNTKYYVIAPGRFTQPYDYSADATSPFNGSDSQVIMLAASEENANAGIYIYSSETSSISSQIKIEVHQYVKDSNYNLRKYKTKLVNNSTTTFETEGPHGFDKVLNSTIDQEILLPQKVFFRVGPDISGSALPEKSISSGSGVLRYDVEYFVRYVKPLVGEPESKYNTRFTIHASLEAAKNGTNAIEFIANSGSEFYVYSNKRRVPLRFDPELTAKPIPVSISSIRRTPTIPEGSTVATGGINAIKCGNLVGTTLILARHGLATGDSVLVTECSNSTFNTQIAVSVTVVDEYTFTYPTTQTSAVNNGSGGFTTATGKVKKITSVIGANIGGCWYLRSSPSNNAIYDRAVLISTRTSSDTYFTRVDDTRALQDKIYRLRYVIPKNGNYRDPINGFVLKVRTDDTRRLLPQKIILKPVIVSDQSFPKVIYNGERLGLTTTEQINGSAFNTANPSFVSTYDPYNNALYFNSSDTNTTYNDTSSNISFKVQSAKKIVQENKPYLELTVFDVGITNPAFKNKVFTSLKVSEPQGGNNGNFTVGQTITWSGYSSGSATVHAWFQDTNYLIIRDATVPVTFNAFQKTIFTQGTGAAQRTADLLESPDGGRSDRSNYLYTTDGASVYTMTPGDTVVLPKDTGNASYYIDSVEDVDDLENTYYIFKSETIRKRVKGQQDGVYYLTCIRGDIRPYPTGSGVGENFRNFKFSQPVSRVYPQNYKNDPLWFQITDNVTNNENPSRDTSIQDPPASTSAADNYVHGYVTISDSRESTTKETIVDLTKDPGIGQNIFAGENAITAQEGGASAGAESRKISITGNTDFPTQKRLYVELRRPSIARSGNHTFEYLGFGPGNYSTGFPARQQVVLTENQDFYAQAKKEDAGIVLYTGLNSSGDLYIGNRKINAITGEEKLLDAPILDEEDEEVSLVGSLVTTFDDPVTFNNTVLFLKTPVAGEPSISFRTPVEIDSDSLDSIGQILNPPLTIINNTPISTHPDADPLVNGFGDITIGNNVIRFGVWKINTRGLQNYSIRTASNNMLPANEGGMLDYSSTINPNPLALFAAGSANPQFKLFGSNKWSSTTPPKSGDLLFKGDKVGYSGSLGWILANDFTSLSIAAIGNEVASITTYSETQLIKITWATGITNSSLGISNTSSFRLRNFNSLNNSLNSGANGTWAMPPSVNISGGPQESRDGSTGFARPNSPYIYLLIADIQTSSTIYSASAMLGVGAEILLSAEIWKETGVIGSESIRTETSQWGNFKVGINTLSRAAHVAFENGFTSVETEPRANLDVVGTTFISGKTIKDYLSTAAANGKPNQSGTSKTTTNEDNALVVGGNSLNPGTAAATLRLATTDDSSPDGVGYQTGGRIGINTVLADLDRNLVIDGNARITGDFKFENDIDINGGGTTSTADVRTSITTGTFNLLSNTGFTGTLNLGNWAPTVNFAARATLLDIGNTTTSDQIIDVGNAAVNQIVNIGTTGTGTHDVNIATAATSTTTLDVFNASANVRVDIGNPSVSATSSRITLGGAYNANESNSFLEVKTKSAKFFGDIQIGSNKSLADTVVLGTSAGSVNFFSTSGSASTISFGLNASELNIGGQGGTTTIRNSLTVDASVLSKGNITLDGGTATFSFNGTRAQLGSAIASHTGFPNNAPLDKNIDLVTVVSGFNNAIDTAGAGPWGGSFFQNAIGTYTANSGAALVALTGNQFYLPLASSPTYAEGDDILIDSTVASGVHPEIVKVASGGLVRTTASPYYIIVERQPYGTFLPQKTNHPDDSITRKVNVAIDATWLTANTDGAGTSDVFNLAEFGGTLANGDYIFVDRNTTGTTGEAVKIASSVGATAQKLIVTNGAGATKFEVDSVTGATIVSDAISLGGLTVYGPLNFVGSCVSTGENRKFKLSNTTGETFSVDMCNGETTITQGTLTTDVKALDATATWNSAATTFTGIKLNVTNTASNDASKLIDLQTGGTTRFNVDASSGDTYLRGDLTVNGDTIKSSTATALTLSGADVTVAGDLTVTGNDIKSSTGATVLTLNSPSTTAGNDATFADNLTVTGDLTVNGGDFAVNSGGTERFNVNSTDVSVNLGGAERFSVNSDGAIDLGGITRYFTPTGGRKWVFVPTSSNSQNSITNDERLVSNTSYFVTPSGDGSVLILLLPTTAQNGDVIRIVDVAGQLKYNTQLILRAPSGVRVQGDATGSALGLQSGTYAGGELIVNTPNAAFGLVYVGSTDGNQIPIPSTYRGWWLMEI